MTRTIAARYAGRCQTCGYEYAAGDSITHIGYRKRVHAGCSAQSNGEAAVTQTAPAVVPAAPSLMPLNEIATIVRRLLEGAELSRR
jgi:hypothetical protein